MKRLFAYAFLVIAIPVIAMAPNGTKNSELDAFFAQKQEGARRHTNRKNEKNNHPNSKFLKPTDVQRSHKNNLPAN